MESTQLIGRLDRADWARLELAETGFEWDAAWEAALAAGARSPALAAMAQARRAGARPRAAALFAAAMAAEAVAPALAPAQLRQLRGPLADWLPEVPAPALPRRRSGGWIALRRCPVAAVVGQLVAGGR